MGVTLLQRPPSSVKLLSQPVQRPISSHFTICHAGIPRSSRSKPEEDHVEQLLTTTATTALPNDSQIRKVLYISVQSFTHFKRHRTCHQWGGWMCLLHTSAANLLQRLRHCRPRDAESESPRQRALALQKLQHRIANLPPAQRLGTCVYSSLFILYQLSAC